MAVVEACRNISCVGATPLAITDGLNLGNPEKEDVQFQLFQTIKGLRDACDKLEIPVISGNASLYNESKNYSIFPTPIIGAIGLIDDFQNCISSSFKKEKDLIIALGNDVFGDNPKYLAGSEYQKLFHKQLSGKPSLNIDFEKQLQKVIRKLINSCLIKSAHDCTSGGLAVTISECCALGDLGAEIDMPITSNWEIPLFGENKSTIILSASLKNYKKIEEVCLSHSIPCKKIGIVSSDKLIIKDVLEITLKEIVDSWTSGLENFT